MAAPQDNHNTLHTTQQCHSNHSQQPSSRQCQLMCATSQTKPPHTSAACTAGLPAGTTCCGTACASFPQHAMICKPCLQPHVTQHAQHTTMRDGLVADPHNGQVKTLPPTHCAQKQNKKHKPHQAFTSRSAAAFPGTSAHIACNHSPTRIRCCSYCS